MALLRMEITVERRGKSRSEPRGITRLKMAARQDVDKCATLRNNLTPKFRESNPNFAFFPLAIRGGNAGPHPPTRNPRKSRNPEICFTPPTNLNMMNMKMLRMHGAFGAVQ
jgi:hypothetical protein